MTVEDLLLIVWDSASSWRRDESGWQAPKMMSYADSSSVNTTWLLLIKSHTEYRYLLFGWALTHIILKG